MIKAPNWCKNALMSTRGWVDPESGELLVSRRFSRTEVAEYNGQTEEAVVAPVAKPVVLNEVMPEPVFAPVMNEVPMFETAEEVMVEGPDFRSMSKLQIEAWAREELDVELDRRKSKNALIAEVKELI